MGGLVCNFNGGVLFLPSTQWLLVLLLPVSIPAILAACYCIILVCVGIVDLLEHRVPNGIIFPATGLALLASLWLPEPGRTFLLSLGGAAVGLVSFLTLYHLGARLYGPDALGMGDVKLAMLLGAMVGLRWVGVVLLLGILLAGAAAAWLLLVGRARRQQHLPYGFYLCLAGLIIILFIPLY